jgi:uncharacterized protein YcbK (DUF882 family)
MKTRAGKLFLFACVLLLAACSSSSHGHRDQIGTGLAKAKADPLVQRSIVMEHPESHERINVIYFHDGHYDATAMHAINRLCRDRRADFTGPMDPELIDFLVDLRTRLGLPPSVTFEILSGYRTASTNEYLARGNKNVALESKHLHGWAVDFRITGVNGRAIVEIAKTMQRGGAAFYPSSNHVHVDIGNIRTWHEK